MANFTTCNSILEDVADWLNENGDQDICDQLKSTEPPKGGVSNGLVEKETVGNSLRAWIDAATPAERNKLLAAIYPECAVGFLKLRVRPEANDVEIIAYEPSTDLDYYTPDTPSSVQPIFDWGDGTPPSTSPHRYDTIGGDTEYIITEISGCHGKSIRTTSYYGLVDDLTGNNNLGVVEIIDFGSAQNVRLGNPKLTTVPSVLPKTLTGLELTFADATFFNQDVSDWDTSHVMHMGATFWRCVNFNQPIQKWDVSKVRTTHKMFYKTEQFNQPLDDWNLSSALDTSHMFDYAVGFNSSVVGLVKGSVKSIACMFYYATAFNQDLSSWDVSGCENAEALFGRAYAFNGNIENWDVKNIINANAMFLEAHAFSGQLTNWETDSLVQADHMFANASSFNGAIGGWNTSQVTHMVGMFIGTTLFNQDLSGWDVSSVIEHSAFDFNTPAWTLPKPNF